jgi:alpha-glucosidase
MNKMSHEAMADFCPNARPFVVSRSGCAGLQRYASTWAGDNATSWDALKYDIATILNMGLSGLANCGCDIGGFYGGRPEEELFVRWVQAGIFFPRFSIHSCNNDNTVTEPWMYKKSLPIIRAAIKLRYSLLPYLYSLLQKASQDGTPIMRPLCFEFPTDESTAKDCGQFMLGASLLAAPIVEQGIKEKSIYLPKGCDWYDYYTHQKYQGGQTVAVPVSLETIPLFIKDDAFIPRNYEIFSISKDKETYFDIVVAVAKNSNYEIYEDDGLSNDFKAGKWLKTKVSISKVGAKFILDFKYEGSFESSVKNIFLEVINIQKAPFKVFIDKQEIDQYLNEHVLEKQEFGWHYDMDFKAARIKFARPQKDYVVTISFEAFDLIGMALSEDQN